MTQDNDVSLPAVFIHMQKKTPFCINSVSISIYSALIILTIQSYLDLYLYLDCPVAALFLLHGTVNGESLLHYSRSLLCTGNSICSIYYH